MRDKLSETRNANIKFKMRVFTVHIACLHKLSTFNCKISTILCPTLPLHDLILCYLLTKWLQVKIFPYIYSCHALPVVCLDVMSAL